MSDLQIHMVVAALLFIFFNRLGQVSLGKIRMPVMFSIALIGLLIFAKEYVDFIYFGREMSDSDIRGGVWGVVLGVGIEFTINNLTAWWSRL